MHPTPYITPEGIPMAAPKKTALQNSDSEEDILDVGHDVTATFDNSPSNPTERASSENLGTVREDDDLEEDLDEDEDDDLDEDDEDDEDVEDEEDEDESADEYDEAEDDDDEEIDEDEEDDEDIDTDEEDEDEDDEDDLDTVPRASSIYRKM
jgi:hypothetical protein